MRTALLAPGYLGDTPTDVDPLGNNRIARAKKYVEFYSKLLPRLGAAWMFFCDNGSSLENIKQVGGLTLDPESHEINNLGGDVPVTHILYPNVQRTGPSSMPYCWRAEWQIRKLFEWGYDKVIFIDTDLYLISKRMIDWTKAVDSGWHSVLDRMYTWPAPEFQVVVKGCKRFEDYTSGDWRAEDGKCMELTLPFTFVHGEFIYGRFGEDRIPQHPSHDAYGQAPIDMTIQLEA